MATMSDMAPAPNGGLEAFAVLVEARRKDDELVRVWLGDGASHGFARSLARARLFDSADEAIQVADRRGCRIVDVFKVTLAGSALRKCVACG